MKTRRTFLKAGALLGGGLIAGESLIAADTKKDPSSSSPMDFWSVVNGRRSVRKYKSTPVPREDIERILEAASKAPTSGNQQPWKFLVVQNAETIEKMRTECLRLSLERQGVGKLKPDQRETKETEIRNYLDKYFTAPAYIVVLTDKQSAYPDYNHWDGPLAAAQLILAARALGYGTVFITDVIPEEVTRKVLKIPERYTRICITPLGRPEKWPDMPPKKKASEVIAWETL